MQEQTAFADLFKRLARIDEIDMRVGLICEQLGSFSIEEALELVRNAYHVAALGNADAQVVFLALGWALFEPQLAHRRAELGVEDNRLRIDDFCFFGNGFFCVPSLPS